jgi:hypothetical protein
MELNGLAARKAHQEGLKGEAARKRIGELVADPTDDMFERALDYGRYLTFQRKLGPVGQKVSGITQENLVAKIFLPFIRTPTNLIKFAAERSPAAPLLKEWRADFKAGGARRDLALAKAALGTGFGIAMYQGALEGHLTGSAPSDQKKARLLYADGWQPYSIKLGDQWYSYKRLDPFSTTIGVAADLATMEGGLTDKQREDKATLLIASLMGNLASKTWLSGLSDLTEALTDPERHADNLKSRLVASFLVPNFATQIGRTIDPVRRERDGVVEELRSRVPGLSDGLLPQRDIWGEEIRSGDNLGPDILSPFWVSEALEDPVNAALLSLDYAPGYPSKTVGGRELSPEEYDRYSELAGKESHARLSDLVASPEWEALDHEGKTKAAKKIVDQAREDARDQLSSGVSATGGWPGQPVGGASPERWPGQPVQGGASSADQWPGQPAPQADVVGSLQSEIPGVRFTSGFRTPEYQADMRRRGYKPAQNSAHLTGSALDMLPPPGKSLGWLRSQVARAHPDARLLVHDGHLHAEFPDWFGAPSLGGAS